MENIHNSEEGKNSESVKNEKVEVVIVKKRADGNNEECYPEQTMRIKWINTIVTTLSAVIAIGISIVSYVTVKEIQYEFSQQQTQFQEQINTIENVIEQDQYVDVIQPRDNDVLIKTNDDKWIVIPMLTVEDISIPDRIIEERHSSSELSTENYPKKGLFDIDESKISTNDTFTYKVPTILINPNKLMSLSTFIEKIFVEFNIYTNDGLQKYTTDKKEIDLENLEYNNVFLNVELPYQYVTDKALDVLNGGNGINKIKIGVVIEYNFDSPEPYKTPYIQDTFCEIDEA